MITEIILGIATVALVWFVLWARANAPKCPECAFERLTILKDTENGCLLRCTRCGFEFEF